VAIRKELKLQMPIIAFTAEHGWVLRIHCMFTECSLNVH
jgi:hypothetical protein